MKNAINKRRKVNEKFVKVDDDSSSVETVEETDRREDNSIDSF